MSSWEVSMGIGSPAVVDGYDAGKLCVLAAMLRH